MNFRRYFNVLERSYNLVISNSEAGIEIRLTQDDLEKLVKFINENYYIEELLDANNE